MARSTKPGARTGKTAPATATGHGATATRRHRAQEAISGFIRTLEKLDAATPRQGVGPTRNKAVAGVPEGK